MSLNHTCRACFQAFRTQSRLQLRTLRIDLPTRTYASTSKPPSSTPSSTPPAPSEEEFKLDPSEKALHEQMRQQLSSGQTLRSRTYQETSPSKRSYTETVAEGVRNIAPGVTETYVAYGSTLEMVKECLAKADYEIERDAKGEANKTEEGEEIGTGKGGWWLDDVKLPPTFSTWSQVSMLYMYLLTTRLRLLPAAHTKQWQQHFNDHFFTLAEDRMAVQHQLTSGSIRQRYLKDLFAQWRGCILSYDEGLLKGDAVLAAAVWRNVFKGREDVDGLVLAQVVAWMRAELERLDKVGDERFVKGRWGFGSPAEMSKGVIVESKFMRELEAGGS